MVLTLSCHARAQPPTNPDLLRIHILRFGLDSPKHYPVTSTV